MPSVVRYPKMLLLRPGVQVTAQPQDVPWIPARQTAGMTKRGQTAGMTKRGQTAGMTERIDRGDDKERIDRGDDKERIDCGDDGEDRPRG